MEPKGEPQGRNGGEPEREGPDFLAGGGALGQLIAAHDWPSTPLGPLSSWPGHLRTTVGLLLRSPVPIVTLWGEDGIMIYNDAYSVFAGGRHPRLLGSKVREGWPEVADFNDNVMKVGLAGGTLAYRDQELTLHRHGRPEQVWMNLDYSPIPGVDGRPAGVIAIVVETTGKVRAEGELRVTAEALATLNAELGQRVEERTRERDRMWRLSTDIMLVAGFDARIEAVNPAWTALLGWGETELLGQDFMAFIHPDDSAATLAEVGSLSSGRTTLRFENRYRRKDGTYRWLSWTAVPDKRFIHAVGRDIQAEKEAAETLRRTEEALRQSQKMEAVGQLTGGIAHDFNNLLTGITGSLELLRTRLAQGRLADLDRYIATAHGAAGRAAALTHRLLAFARRQTLDPRPTNVNRLISGMEELIRRTVGPAVAVEVVGTAGLWPVLVDPNQLESALLNLCINARDAMPDGGRITVETANRWMDEHMARERDLPPGQYLSLCVTDTGTGMTPEVIERAFDPFFTTKPLGQGTGLGLSMIYGFVRQSGGQIRIYSEIGQGTTVCLYLPRHHGAEDAAESAAALAAAPRAERGETVLIVDDEPTVRMLVTEVLQELGYTALEAGDGTAGLRALRSDARIDLLVTDVGLPGGMNGRQLADAARVTRPGLRVLFITGYAENAVLGNGHLEPGMHVLTKPFAMEALAGRIRDLIEGGA
ncbi:PAS domain S-box protein [Pararoseomonas sp. SCSIO 73927]|uniref:hybrid sensor histidine kinase/response regulator n=1 Tax=Pararoseomonas sp. SCSIO 73927 TaxID=3114537 RepID=UPI0030D50E63